MYAMQKAHIPKVRFELPTIDREAKVLVMFLRSGPEAWKKHIYERHPELTVALRGVTDVDEIYKVCYVHARRFRHDHAQEFRKALRDNEALWHPIEEEYLKTLREHFEIDYPSHRRVMRAYVSMVPMYPRWLSQWSFNVSYFQPDRIREIACHEIQHFLYFKKWLEVFPETTYKELNRPHLVWMLSELVAPVILNEHPEFSKLLTRKQETYKHFQKIRVDGKQPTTHLARMYRKHLRSGAPFESFLREIWEFAQTNKEALLKA